MNGPNLYHSYIEQPKGMNERIMYSENSDSSIQAVTGWFGEGLEMIDDIGHRSLDQDVP